MENTKCWLSTWHGEVMGPFHWVSAHMPPFSYLNNSSYLPPSIHSANCGIGPLCVGYFINAGLDQSDHFLTIFLIVAVKTVVVRLTGQFWTLLTSSRHFRHQYVILIACTSTEVQRCMLKWTEGKQSCMSGASSSSFKDLF